MMVVESPAAGSLRNFVYVHSQKGMLIVAWTATLGSLYYSKIVEFLPCEFCWYQRIAMYPIAVLILVATLTRSRLASRYIVVLAGIGLSLSIFHYQLQLFPEQGTVCSLGAPCTTKYVEEFGFVTIPFMAGSGFLSILLLQVAAWRADYLYSRQYIMDASEEDAEPA